jgi:predicted DCC family thiol-disulfide oxidoreductase YuxK
MRVYLQHLILFDDGCSLCWRSVNRIRAWDRKRQFHYSPLREKLAKQALKTKYEKFKNANTLVLIENYPSPSPKIWIKGRAVMRILWLIGGWGKLIGWLAWFPLGVDQIYSFVAKRRHRF